MAAFTKSWRRDRQHCPMLNDASLSLARRGPDWVRGLSPEMEERPTLRPAGVLFFARFR